MFFTKKVLEKVIFQNKISRKALEKKIRSSIK